MQCRKCKTTKDLADFPKNRAKKSGIDSKCRACFAIDHAAWYARNKDRVAAVNKENYSKIKDRKTEYAKAYRAANREKVDARNRDWQARNPDKVAEYRARSLAKPENVDRKKTYDKQFQETGYYAAYREGNREKAAAAAKQWRERNKERAAALAKQSKFRRRTRMAGVKCDLTAEQWRMIKLAYRNCCAYCGEKAKLTQDHVIPVSKGGEHTAKNIVPACLPCNIRKRDGKPQRVFQPHLLGEAAA